jgi:acetoin utilization deacetylase AcuC-like enzyme
VTIIYTDANQVHDPPFEIYEHELSPYRETAARAETIINTLREHRRGRIIAPDKFPIRHIYDVHRPQYVEFVKNSSKNLGSDVLYPSYFISDTYAPITAGTYTAALSAVNSALTGAKLVLNGERQVYSLCRPPGHHAAHRSMGGYCYFNNAAIAAHYLSAHGRVAILDIDLHHGNGTQEVFYDRDDVLYVSLHADPDNFYPYISGFADEKGRGPGLGYNINYPLRPHTTDAEYLKALQPPLADVRRFKPDFLIVSAGFDTFKDDPIGSFDLTEQVYGKIAKQIAGLDLPSLIIQEGGYCVERLGELADNFLGDFKV